MYVTTQYIGGAGRVRFEFIEALHDLPANQDPQSHTLNFGDEPRAGETRHLIIGLGFVTAAGVKPDSITVGGDAASEVIAQTPAGVVCVGQGLYIVEKPTGTSGTIAFGVPSGDIDGGQIVVWAAYNISSATARDTAADATTGAGTTVIDLDVVQGGAIFAVGSISNVTPMSADWTGVTEDSANETASDQSWAASQFDLAAEAPRTVRVSRDVGGSPFKIPSVAASFR